jgi:ankyrin repeat protein
MGSHYSKLKKALEKGDELKALEIYKKNSDIRKKLNANAIINDYTLDTYMHVAAKFGMFEFLKYLLNENNGNPNKQNKRKQTVLHKACEGAKDQVQIECMKLLFQWRENSTKTTSNNKNIICSSETNIDKLCDIDVNAKDDVIILKCLNIFNFFKRQKI